MAEGKKVIAITEIHRTIVPGEPGDKVKGIRPKPPKVQIIAPKTVFMASTTKDDDGVSEFDSLLAAGAIREPQSDEKVEVDIKNVVPGDDANARKTATKKAVNKKADAGSGPKAVADMNGSELDTYLESSSHDAPAGWSAMKVDDKKAWLASADANDLV